MGHHYVPQFYLRGFANNNAIWVHDHLEARTFVSQPKTIANESNMYTEELEQYLANSVEEPAKPAIENIRERKPLTEAERNALARYVIALWKRVPEGRARAAARLPNVVASVRDDLHEGLAAAAAANPSLSALAEARKADVDRIISIYESDPPPDIWHDSLAQDRSPRVVDGLISMEWRFLYSEELQFIACDNPVFFFSHEGIGRPTSELTIPFSSTVALWANRRPKNGPVYVQATPVTVRELNRRSASNATRFVYSERNEPWILPFVCKRKYSLNRLS